MISFRGKGLWRDRGKVRVLDDHRVEVKLGASYPRTIPEIRWITPIYHPNISEIGMVCLGGYGTHWVPSVQLDELCVMLWDMARYHNYELASAAFQIGIVLCSAAVITSMVLLAWLAGGVAIIGVAFMGLGLLAPHALHLG